MKLKCPCVLQDFPVHVSQSTLANSSMFTTMTRDIISPLRAVVGESRAAARSYDFSTDEIVCRSRSNPGIGSSMKHSDD